MLDQCFHDWWFSERYSFDSAQYHENGFEISDQRFIELLTEEYSFGLGQLAQVSGSMLLMGFAKISNVSSILTGSSLGGIISSENLRDDLLVLFFISHRGLFDKVWTNKSNDPLVWESFRVYWDNIFCLGGSEFHEFQRGEKKATLELRSLLEYFHSSPKHAALLKQIGYLL